ncbi:MAG TPA: hypothetical protein VMN57_10570 [Anaerolineales bacterium]|nr:hypothetical protein [Anaerolineales bacterium]
MKTLSVSFGNLLAFTVLILLAACSRSQPGTATATTGPTGTAEPPPATDPLPTPTATSFPIPTGLIQIPVPDSARQTAVDLLAADRPPHDFYRAAVQLLGIPVDDLTPTLPAEARVDDRMNFHYNANLAGDYRIVPARLRHLSENAAWWTGVNSTIDDAAILTAAENFETTVFPTNRLVFGREASPGIDNDRRIHFLILQEESWGGFFGYFSPDNQFPTAIKPFSNQREMLVLNANAFPLGSDTFIGKLAHEYQHLIQWNQDANEDLWLNEAFSELAYFLTGAPVIGSPLGPTNAKLFAQHPDSQLTARPERRFGEEDLSVFVHYGAERAFLVYLLEQFGPQFIQDLAANPAPGVVSIQEELDRLPDAPAFDDVYANWLLANLLNQPNLGDGVWGYSEFQPVLPVRDLISTFTDDPIAAQLPPYGARYYEIQSNETVVVSFTGSTLARLTPTDPASGSYAWYSNRGDSSAFTLTRAFDLSGLDSATLNYKVWYEFEELYDFAYVEISTDGGETWTILETAHGTSQDPFDRNYGFGYTGALIGWESESLDLSAYTGGEVLIRFEVITDFSTNRDGLLLDEIEIPELGYFDGAEDDSGGWEAVGFVRSTNFVPVNWVVWLIELSLPTRVTRIVLDDLSQAQILIEGFGSDFPFAAIVISPAAPVTTMNIPYELVFEHP